MRILVIAVVALAALAASGAVRGVDAASAPIDHAVSEVATQTKPIVDEHEGSRVNVQFVVLGLAIGVVVVAGGTAYFVRRRLGLTAYNADEARAAQDAHH